MINNMTLTYEKAKELEKAKFPHENWNEYPVMDCMPPIHAYKEPPTLSELIDACLDLLSKKDEYFVDFNLNFCIPNNKWLINVDLGNGGQGFGETPEEAVANLWLELNKKKCETDGNVLTSMPAQLKCKNCSKRWIFGTEIPDCNKK